MRSHLQAWLHLCLRLGDPKPRTIHSHVRGTYVQAVGSQIERVCCCSTTFETLWSSTASRRDASPLLETAGREDDAASFFLLFLLCFREVGQGGTQVAILLARHARRDGVVFPPQLPIFVETSRTERNETETERRK